MANLRSRRVGGILRYSSSADNSNVMDIDPAGYVDVKQAGGLKIAGTAVAKTAAEINETAVQSVIGQQTKSTNYTLTEADSGLVTNVDTDNVVITLPSTVAGMTFIVRNSASDGAAKVSISPAALDKIMGNGFTSADNKDAINTKATAKKGDYMKLVADGANGWFVTAVRGTWAREA